MPKSFYKNVLKTPCRGEKILSLQIYATTWGKFKKCRKRPPKI